MSPLISDLQERVQALKFFDRHEEVSSYCDNLECDILVACQSAVDHLRAIELKLLEEVRAYRTELLIETYTPLDAQFELDLNQLSLDVQQLSDELSSKQEENTVLLNDLQNRTRELKRRLRISTFMGRFMRFNKNKWFDLDFDNVGKLQIVREDHDPSTSSSIVINEEETIKVDTEKSYLRDILLLGDGTVAYALEDRFIRIYNPSTKDEIKLETMNEAVTLLYLLPDDNFISGGHCGQMQIWNANTKMVIKNFSPHFYSIEDLCLLKNNKLASINTFSKISIWDLYSADNTPPLLQIPELTSRYIFWQLGALSNGCLAVCICMQEDDDVERTTFIKIFDPDTGRQLKSLDLQREDIFSMLVLQNDDIILDSFVGLVKVMNLDDESQSRHYFRVTDGAFMFAQFSNGRLVVAHTKTDDLQPCNAVRVQEVLKGPKRRYRFPYSFSPDHKLLAWEYPRGTFNISRLSF